jgi:glycosyltransferase involved in cell wall biosynthesis
MKESNELRKRFKVTSNRRGIDLLSLIIPVYRNEESLHDLLEAVAGLNTALEGKFEAVFVVDGSPDRCYEILNKQLPEQPFQAKLALLSRNFGSFAAIRAGLEIGEGQRFAVMAADLQEPPELVSVMDKELRTGEVDVVVGVREGRRDPLLSRLPAEIFWGLYRRLVVPEVPPGGVDVFACNRAFRDQLLQMSEQHSSLIAQIFWLGYRRKYVSYTRKERKHGKSAWTLRKKTNYLMDSVFSFTDLPIRLLIRTGGAAAFLSGLFGFLVALLRLSRLIEVTGYAPTILIIIFFGSLNLFGLGIVGSYAWRTYENTKARPLSVVLRSHQFNATIKK